MPESNAPGKYSSTVLMTLMTLVLTMSMSKGGPERWLTPKLFDTRTEEYMDSRGTLLTVDNVYRARMAFSQNDNHGRVDARSDPNYNVIKTDYNNYAMVYSCEYDYSDKTKSEQILVLTREKQPSQEVIDSITEALRTQGLPNLPVTREAQDCPDSEFAFFSSLLKQ